MEPRIRLWLPWAWGTIAVWTLVHWPLIGLQAILPDGVAGCLAGPGALRPLSGPLPHLLLPLALAVASLAPGALALAVLAGPRPLRHAERLVFALSLGLAVIATALAVLGLAGRLTPTAVLCVTLAVSLLPHVVGRPDEIRRTYRALLSLPSRAVSYYMEGETWSRLGLGLVGLGLALTLVRSLIPPWYPDALYYQLTLPRLYLEAGGFVPLPQEPITSGYPGLVQMLFATALAPGCDHVAAAFAWLHYPVALGGVALLARVCGARRSAALAVVVLAAVPHLAWVSGVPLSDVPLTAQVTLALYAASRAAGEGSAGWARVAAAMLGVALATKYQALVPLALILTFLFCCFALKRGPARALRSAAVWVALAMVPFAPWAIKNWLGWGSPLFPLHVPSGVAGPIRDLLTLHRTDWLIHGHGSSLAWLVFDLTFFARPDDLARYEGEVGPLLLALVPLPFLGRRSRSATALGLYSLTLFLLWAAGGREVRYLFAALPALAVFVVSIRPWPCDGRSLPAVVTTGACLSLLWFVGQSRPGADLPYLLGAESRSSYLATLGATADLHRACETLRQAPAGSRALFFWDERGYLCPVPFLPDHLVPSSSSHVLHRIPSDPSGALARLVQLGVTHLLVNRTAWEEAIAENRPWSFGPTLTRLLEDRRIVSVGPPARGGRAPGIEVFAVRGGP